MVRVEDCREEVIGLKPVYCTEGNVTELWLNSGETALDRRSLKAVVRSLAACYALDLKAQHVKVQQYLGRSGGALPFYLTPKRVFIPLKVRKAISENDSVNGFFDVNFLQEIEAGEGRECRAVLSDGRVLELVSRQETARRCRDMGRQVLEELKISSQSDEDEEQAMALARLMVRTVKTMAFRLENIEGWVMNPEAGRKD